MLKKIGKMGKGRRKMRNIMGKRTGKAGDLAFTLLENHWNFVGVYQNGNFTGKKLKSSRGKIRKSDIAPLKNFPVKPPTVPHATLTPLHVICHKTMVSIWVFYVQIDLGKLYLVLLQIIAQFVTASSFRVSHSWNWKFPMRMI